MLLGFEHILHLLEIDGVGEVGLVVCEWDFWDYSGFECKLTPEKVRSVYFLALEFANCSFRASGVCGIGGLW